MWHATLMVRAVAREELDPDLLEILRVAVARRVELRAERFAVHECALDGADFGAVD